MSARRDRRTTRHRARQLKFPCSLKRLVEEGPWPATVAIVSTTAIRLLTRQLFRPGMHVAVDLPGAQGQLTAALFCVTQGKEQIGRPEWIVEGVFVKPLGPEHVDTVRKKIAAAAPRVKGSPPAGWQTNCRLVRVREEGPWLVTLRNVSHHGIGLIADRPFEPGTFLTIELPSIQRRHLQSRLIRVTYVQQLPGSEGWVLGGVFLRGLTKEELQVLL